MINDLNIDELNSVSAAGAVDDSIEAVGNAVKAVGDAAYEAGYRIGKAVASLFD